MSTLEQMSSIKVQDIKLSLSEAGKGEPVLCLHGNPGTKSNFSKMMSMLDKTNIKLVATDRFGHNLTDELQSENDNLWHDTDFYAELINAKLNQKAWVLGHDYGCLTAIKLAIKQPDKVKGLILINPYIIPEAPDDSLSSLPKLSKNFLIGSIMGVFLPYDYEKIFTERLTNTFSPETPSEDYIDSIIQRIARFESVIAFFNDNNIRIKIEDELKEEMKKITVPTFALFGAKDALTSVEKQKEAVSLIPDAKIEVSETSGHFMPYTNPDLCIDFIKKAIAQ